MLRGMAAVTCTRTDIFPNGTVIKCYDRKGFTPFQEGAPHGPVVTEATMTSGTCEFTGLTAGLEYELYALVASKDAVLAVQAPASTAIVAATGSPEPALDNLKAWSFDSAMASGTTILTPAGTLIVVKIPLKEQVKISNVLQYLTTKGATLTAAQCFMGLFQEGTRKLIAEATAAETIAKWEGANSSLQTIPLVTPVVAGPGYVSAGMYYNGTTAPTFSSAPVSTAALINAGVTGKESRFATGNTGLTTALPATIQEAMTAAAFPLWVGLT